MIGKIYFFIVSFLLLFSTYYDLLIVGDLGFYKIFAGVTNLLLILGGYAYFFQRKLFSKEIWKKIFFIALAYMGLGVILQFMPRLLQGEIAIYYFNLEGNITGFIIGNLLFIPLYLFLYKLSGFEMETKKKKR